MAEQAHDAAQEEAQDIDLLQDALLDAVDPSPYNHPKHGPKVTHGPISISNHEPNVIFYQIRQASALLTA